MELLLEAQADLEARDFSGATPLLRAVLAGRFGSNPNPNPNPNPDPNPNPNLP